MKGRQGAQVFPQRVKIILLLMLLAFFSPAGAADDKPLVVIFGDEDYFPYSYAERGAMKGFYTEMLLELAKDLPDYRIALAPVPWKRGLKLVEEGMVMALYPPYRFASRPYFEPYSNPLFNEAVAIFCREDVIPSTGLNVWPDDFSGLKISKNLGFTLAPKGFWDNGEAFNISITEYSGNEANLLAVAVRKSVDCYINDRISILISFQKMQQRLRKVELESRISEIQETITVNKLSTYIGYSKAFLNNNPESHDFVLKMDKAIEKFQHSGAYERFIRDYWGKLAIILPGQPAQPQTE